ncbi:MAG: class I SAM-dependent methyltransferase [Methylococcales bacterium]|nr:class I SAM-dependent methyltransferase [Methylococcales bacterium]
MYVTEPGSARLFEDDRIIWAEQVFGGFKELNVLELGPLEGGHSYLMQNGGAKQITAIEANSRSFLKCLCIKQILKLDRVEFQLGDFMAYLEQKPPAVDLVLASGVLYHMQEPLKLLQHIAAISPRAFIWTHYYDADVISQRPELQPKFGTIETITHNGMTYQCARQSYQDALEWAGFCGGSKPTSRWLTRASLEQALGDFGYTDLCYAFEQPDHPNGPAVAICAQR